MVHLKTFIFFLAIIFAPANQQSGIKVGDLAPNFNLKNVDGKMVSLDSSKDAKGYIVVFTCNTCPYSVMYEQRIIELHQKYAPIGYSVIAIQPNSPQVSVGDSYAKMKEKSNTEGFSFPYVIDNEAQETTMAYGATNTPQVYVLNKEGSAYKVAYIGAIDNNSRNPEAATKRYVELAIDELLAGIPVSTKNTKAIGCTIK